MNLGRGLCSSAGEHLAQTGTEISRKRFSPGGNGRTFGTFEQLEDILDSHLAHMLEHCEKKCY